MTRAGARNPNPFFLHRRWTRASQRFAE
jgi:hypothetical protein